MATATESISFSNIGANTTSFALRGGKYGVGATATGTGTFGLQQLAADGSSWLPVHTAFTTGQNYVSVDVPPGTYRFAVATVTAVYATIARILT
jgi:hypothetical protein